MHGHDRLKNHDGLSSSNIKEVHFMEKLNLSLNKKED